MWWLIPVGIGVGLKLLYDVVSDEEYEARRRWEGKREEVEKSIEEHQRNIYNHIQHAQFSYDFHLLVNLHYSSSQIANSAYRLLDDARSSVLGMNKMLAKSKEDRSTLQVALADAKQMQDRQATYEIYEQLKMIHDLRKNVFTDRDMVTVQQKALLAEVRRLNNQTKELKEFIRDRCDNGGREWYERLEKRKMGGQYSVEQYVNTQDGFFF